MDLDLFTDAALPSMDRWACPVPHPFNGSIVHYGVVLSPAEAELLFDLLLHAAPWKRRTMMMHGREVELPRDIAWYGATKGQGVYAQEASAWPAYLLDTKQLVEELTGHIYNGCLCNLYRDGSNSVAWHSDREAAHGAVASLSLGATRTFRVRSRTDHALTFDFVLPSGALLLMQPGCQLVTEHCVPKTKRPVGPRINLTFRQVER